LCRQGGLISDALAWACLQKKVKLVNKAVREKKVKKNSEEDPRRKTGTKLAKKKKKRKI
jgi:hypothetical protein